MKKIIFTIFVIFLAASFSNIMAQGVPTGVGTPAGATDKNLGDDGIKMRSVEIERIKKEAQSAEAASFAPINKEVVTKFPQIKEDFEALQILEAAIIKAYTTGKTIDYGLIESSADGINKRAKRLDNNLFADTKKDKKVEDESKKEGKTKTLRDLIVQLDTAIGEFVTSKIFSNNKIIEPEVAIKARIDLLNVTQLSEKVGLEAKKLK